MFNWLQHLFTARALQTDNAQLTVKVKELEAQIKENDSVIAVKDEEIRRLNERISRTKANRPRISQGVDYDIFGGN